MFHKDATIKDMLIGTLFACRSTGIMNSVIYDRVKARRKDTIQKSIRRMIKEGIIVSNKDLLLLSDKGKVLAEAKVLFSIVKSPFLKNEKKSMIISFDIPEYKRKTRDWLRKQIREFGYEMIQQSVWVGPSPLPKSFMNKLDEMEIRKSIKFFKLNK